FAGWLAPEGIDEQKTDQPDALLHEPSGAYWFGSVEFGRDILSRVMYGARLSLWVGFISVIGAITVGVFLGVIAGFYGRWLDILSRVMYSAGQSLWVSIISVVGAITVGVFLGVIAGFYERWHDILI